MGKRDLAEVITGSMAANEMGNYTFREHIQVIYDKLNVTGALVIDLKINEVDNVNFVEAMIDTGRWGAHCPDCSGAEYVDPADPVFYCFGCGNETVGGKLRAVHFPAEREDIELLITERPVSVHRGVTKCQIALSSRALTGAERMWNPKETVQQLKDKNKKYGLEYDIKKIKEKRQKVQ